MKIKRLIAQLEAIAEEKPDAEVRLNDKDGDIALFAVTLCNESHAGSDYSNVVWIEGRCDIDIGEELRARFENAAELQVDELDFFMNLIETGLTLDDIYEYLPEQYEYSKQFMEEHGLL